MSQASVTERINESKKEEANMAKRYSESLKAKVLAEIEAGASVSETARKYKISSANQVFRWRKEAAAAKAQTAPVEVLAQASHFVDRQSIVLAPVLDAEPEHFGNGRSVSVMVDQVEALERTVGRMVIDSGLLPAVLNQLR
jgi:transposase-like protein